MATRHKDYYELLGIERSADVKAIKSAYRRLALQYHPDVARRKRAADRFREIHDAYTVLSDPKRRARYDAVWTADQTRAKHGGPPKRDGAVSRGNVRSYSFDLGGLGIRVGLGWADVSGAPRTSHLHRREVSAERRAADRP